MKKISIFLLIIVLIILTIGTFIIIPIIQDKKDKYDLEGIFKVIPIFNDNQVCNNIRFTTRDRMMGTDAAISCDYRPSYDFNTTMEKYVNYLTNSKWSFLSKTQNEDYFYYSNGCYRLTIHIPSRTKSLTDYGNGTIAKDIQKGDPSLDISIGKFNC